MAAALQAFGPLVAALVAILLVLVTGLDQRSALPPPVVDWFYGFVLGLYPLFGAALVYGLASIGFAAVRPGTPGPVRRVLGGVVAVALLLGASLYPTFGGLVLRGAFATGGVAFLGQQPMGIAYALGSAAAAFVFGLVLGAGRWLVAGRVAPRGGWRHRLLRGGAQVLIRYLALWFAFAILGLALRAGFGAWPRRPLTGADALLAAALVLVAFLPHACLDRWLIPAGSTSGRRVAHPAPGWLIRTAEYEKMV